MKKMKVGRYVGIGFLAIVIVVGLICAGSIVETVEKGTYQVKQAAISGEMSAKMTPGLWFQNFGDIDIWPKAETYFFTHDNDTKGDVDEDTSIEVRFNDGSMCKISGTLRIVMPTTESDAIKLTSEQGHKTYADVQEKLIKPTLRNVLRSTANLMSARESYSEKRLDFITWSRDQISNGVYKTKAETKQVEDLVTGEKTWKEVKVIKTEGDIEGGTPLYELNPMKDTGIVLANFEIKSFVYEKKVQAQISKQQEARMAVETAKAEAEKAKQAELKAIAEGKRDVATAKYEKEQDKIRAVVEAQKEKEVFELNAERDKNVAVIAGNKRKEVATLDRDAAKLKKEELILLGEGESERKRLVLAADGALEQKLKAVVQMNEDAMIALSKRPVPQNYFAGGGTNGSTGASGYDEEMVRVLKLMNMQLVKGLNLDMTVKGQNQ
jgi:regulator of protease activity HflC (stomatin/prohibitin superfamily)